jgi:hypothetical protein
MNDHKNLNSFYEEVDKATYERGDLDPIGKSVVLFRVAIENGAAAVGILGILHVMSKLLTSTLAIADDEGSHEDFLENFDPDDPVKH